MHLYNSFNWDKPRSSFMHLYNSFNWDKPLKMVSADGQTDGFSFGSISHLVWFICYGKCYPVGCSIYNWVYGIIGGLEISLISSDIIGGLTLLCWVLANMRL